jgi:hypothetical protein
MPLTTDAQLLFFSGTYNTIWEPEYPTDDNGDECDGDLNFGAYLNYLGKLITTEVANLLPFDDCDVVFKSVYYPREYNFSTDSITVVLNNYHNNISILRGYAQYHKKQFQTYLNNHFTSYDGFMSYYSNDYDDWIQQDINDFGEVENGVYISFYLQNEICPDMNMYIYDGIYSYMNEWIYENFEYAED